MAGCHATGVSLETPHDQIFTSSFHPTLEKQLLVGRTLSRTGLTPSLVLRILYWACPERVWLSRIAPHPRKLLRQDMTQLREHLRDRSHVTSPVTLLLGSPGMWALQLEELALSKKAKEQDQLYLSHCGEEFALMVRLLAMYGSSLRTLHVVADPCDAPARGAVALLFAVLAHGALPGLKHLTLCHSGGGGSSFLAPLMRSGASPLTRLNTLCLSLQESHVPFEHLVWLANQNRLPSLRNLTLFGESRVVDTDVAALLKALLSNGRHPLAELDLRASSVGHETLSYLVERLENRTLPNLTKVQVTSTVENASLCGRIQTLLPAQANQ